MTAADGGVRGALFHSARSFLSVREGIASAIDAAKKRACIFRMGESYNYIRVGGRCLQSTHFQLRAKSTPGWDTLSFAQPRHSSRMKRPLDETGKMTGMDRHGLAAGGVASYGD